MSIPEKIQAMIRENIRQYGFMVQGVFESKEQPQFSYTIGLMDLVQTPELIIVGLPMDFAHHFIHVTLNEYVKLGVEIPIGEPITNIAAMPVMFMECDDDLVQEYAVQAFAYYERKRGKHPKFLQMVLCDKKGKFPDHPEFDHEVMGRVQPLLYHPVQKH